MPLLEDLVLGHTVTPSPFNPLGVKGVGEAGTVGAPAAVANAVVDALAARGVRHVDMPFTRENLASAQRLPMASGIEIDPATAARAFGDGYFNLLRRGADGSLILSSDHWRLDQATAEVFHFSAR